MKEDEDYQDYKVDLMNRLRYIVYYVDNSVLTRFVTGNADEIENLRFEISRSELDKLAEELHNEEVDNYIAGI